MSTTLQERPGLTADYLDLVDAATDDPTTRVEAWKLTGADRDVYDAGFLTGHALATAELQNEIERLRQQVAQAEDDADRYYAEMCRRPAAPQPEHISYAELCRRRGDTDHAERAEQASRHRLAA